MAFESTIRAAHELNNTREHLAWRLKTEYNLHVKSLATVSSKRFTMEMNVVWAAKIVLSWQEENTEK